jgi:hypothetical protein
LSVKDCNVVLSAPCYFTKEQCEYLKWRLDLLFLTSVGTRSNSVWPFLVFKRLT